MNDHTQEDLRKFGGLDYGNVVELLRKSFLDGGLTDMEQYVYGLKYGLLGTLDNNRTDAAAPNPLNDAELAQEIHNFTGEVMTDSRIFGILDKAEGKVSHYVWTAVNCAVREFLGKQD